MAEPQGRIERIAGWLPECDAMATMISPTLAVTIASALRDGVGPFELRMERSRVTATVVAANDDRDLALLETSIPVAIPSYDFGEPLGTRAETVFVIEGRPHRIDVQVVGPDGVAFDYVPGMQTAARGAPVVEGGRLVGILRHYIGETSWQMATARELSEQPLSSLPRPAASSEPDLFTRLTGSSRRALSYAAGIERGGPISMLSLIQGLHENYAGSTLRLFRARGVTVPDYEGEPVALTELPPMDDRVRRALAEAARIADSRGESRIRSRHLLYGALTVEPFQGLTAEDVQLDDDRSVVGHRADTVDGEDLLDIKREARVLAGVLGAAGVEPPISLGLFGEWGSGKSFFMREMERQFGAIEGKPGYCRNIVQIWFNAWHYIDTPNLWASLAAEIFERLDFELSVRGGSRPRDETAHRRAGALAKSAQKRSELAVLTAQRTAIESQLEEVHNGLEELGDERVIASKIGLRRVFTAGVDAASIDPESKKEIAAIGEKIAEAREKVHLTEKNVADLRETTRRGRAMLLAARKVPLTSWLLVVLFLLLIVGGAFGLLQRMKEWLAGSMVAIGAIGTIVTALFTRGAKAAWALYTAWRLKERLIHEEREVRARPLLDRQSRLQDELERKKNAEEEKAAELQTSEQEIADLEPKRQMSNFVRERKKSTDYTRHLGVIASAHDDFAELSRLLRSSTRGAGDKSVPDVDRIVLYIDDLDRCPEDKVVDVLQAVHLLLAFPLFIVVVGVDSRWLLHSLQRHLRQFDVKDLELSDELWKSTPLNYLEKIFQIPFSIRRMRPGAFGELIENLTRPQKEVAREREQKAPPLAQSSTPSTPQPERPAIQIVPPATAETQHTSATAMQQPQGSPPDVDYLELKSWETEDMKAVYPLIPSPRAAKRFVNTYRLLRGMIDEYQSKLFIGNNNAGEYRAVLVMLAMLTGYPEETTELLKALVGGGAVEPDWWTFAEARIENDDLRRHLTAIKPSLAPVPPISIFAKWAPDVARFSFHSGRMAALSANS